MNTSTRVQLAPGQRGCCDIAGRLMMMAAAPIRVEQLVARAQAQGEGSRAQIISCVEDLIASGLLIELDEVAP